MKRIEIIPAVLFIACLLAIGSALVIIAFKLFCLITPKIFILTIAILALIIWIRIVFSYNFELWIIPNKNETWTRVKTFKTLSDLHYWLDDDRNSYIDWKIRFIRA